MKTISVVNGKTRRNLYITVVSLYVIISLFFLISTEFLYRRTKGMLVDESVKGTTSHIKQCYELFSKSLQHASSLAVSDSNFIQALEHENANQISIALKPIVENFINSQNAFFSIVDQNGSEVYTTGHDSLHIYSNQNNYTLDSLINTSISFTPSGIFYQHSNSVVVNTKTYNLLLGIRIEDGIKSVTPESKVFPYLVTYTHNFHNNPTKPSVISVSESENAKAIAQKLEQSSKWVKSAVRINKAHYAIVDASHELLPVGISKSKLLFAIDITEYHKTYLNNLLRLMGFILIFLVVVLVIIRFTHNSIISLLLSLEKKLDLKLEHRTREIINYNDQLNQFFNATANGIRIIDKNFNVLNVNNSFCHLTGISEDSIIGKKCFEAFPSNNCHTTNCPLEQIKQGLSIVQSKEIRVNSFGEKLVYQYKARPFVTKEGDLIGIVEDFKDITELHNTQEKVLQTKKQYETLLDSMPVGIFIRDFEGNMFYQNSYMNKVFGPFEHGRSNLKNIYPTHINRFFEEDKLVDKYGLFVAEEKLHDNNGVERTYVTHKFKFIGINNKALIGGVSIDITKRKKAEHNSYVLTKAIVNSPIGVLITSPTGHVEFCNPEFEKYADSPSEHILETIFPSFLPSKDNKLQDPIGVAIGGGVFQGEVHLSLYNTMPQWYALSIAPVLDREGEIAHLIFVFDNITDRKEYEKQIVIAKSKAEESDRLKTSFLSNLSHEIRTPLNAILGFSSLLNKADISPEERNEIPGLLVNHSNSLLNLINDLIDISAIETNQFTVKKSECKLNQVLLDSFNEVVGNKSMLDQKTIKTVVKLGITEENFTILSDSKRLAQVFKHLISNAIKFTSNGFVEIGYTFKDANNLLFYIIDTGVGLSEEEKSIIFNPFRQADDSRTRSFNGMGLGLAISKHIIDRLGGKIWVNSTKNQGSTFYFSLPYIPVKNKFDTVVFPPQHKKKFNWDSKTILVADDIDSNYKFIQTLLRPTGVNLIWAKNGREAVDMVKSNKVDLILMDIVMPEVDGFEATRMIKQINGNIKVICQTAYPATEHQLACKECGMDSYLAKPIAPASMLQTISEFISKN